MTNELLVEFYSEEMPASLIKDAAESLKNNLVKELTKENYSFSKDSFFFTPTRIAITIYGLEPNKDNSVIEIRGPNSNAPNKAIEGFAKSMNSNISSLIKKKTDKGEYYFYKEEKRNINVDLNLSKILEKSFSKFIWKKSMRWGNNSLKWVRPLKNILCLYKGKKIIFSLKELKSNNFFFAKNVMMQDKILITSLSQYFKILKKYNIEINQNYRREIILNEGKKIAYKAKLNFEPDAKLLQEVVSLVERPFPLLANFKKEFLTLPNEVLITTMEKNQRYFPLRDINNSLSNTFLLVSNIMPLDKGKNIIKGNERVINARLSDARFFYEKDLASSFLKNKGELKKLIFHSQLGNIYDKLLRLKKLSGFLNKKINLSKKNKKDLDASIDLCKNDLVSELVKEFPTLQGIMGYHYAIRSKINIVVAEAILQHYKPQGPKENIPSSLIPKLLALIDKLDTLVGFFLIDKQPTASKDPYALRRSTLGIIRIIVDGNLNIKLGDLIEESIKIYVKKLNIKINSRLKKEQISKFVIERYENYLKEFYKVDIALLKSIPTDYSTLSLKVMNAKILKLFHFFKNQDGQNVLKSLKRAYNIIEELENDNKTSSYKVNVALFCSKEEKKLYNALEELDKKINNNDIKKDINLLFSLLVKLCKPIDNFFENIKINDNNNVLRKNRLALLIALKKSTDQILDFSILIKGKEA